MFYGYAEYFVLNFLLITMDVECNNAVLGLYSQALSFEPRSVDKVQKNERDMEDRSYK